MKQGDVPISDHVRVGVALSGGGARGLAQLGVLKVLESEGVPIHLVAGTSIGAIVGGLYASHLDAELVRDRVLATLASRDMQGLDLERVMQASGITPVRREGQKAPSGPLAWARKLYRRARTARTALTQLAVLPGEVVTELYGNLFEGRTFEQTLIPFAAVAVDVMQGREVVIASGPLARGVAASSAIAGIFPPVQIQGRLLIDGGYASPVPIAAARTMGANVVIAVDVSASRIDRPKLHNAVEVAMRSSEISLLALEQEQIRHADVVVSTHGKPRHWSDYSEPAEAIAAGEAAARERLDAIHAAIQERARLFV